MSQLNKELFTRNLTDADSPFIITKDDGITQYSLNLIAGAATITGSRKLNSLDSAAINLVIGQPFSGSVSEGATVILTIAVGANVDFAAQ